MSCSFRQDFLWQFVMGHCGLPQEICCTYYHGGSNLLVFLVWIIMPLGFFMKALCVCVWIHNRSTGNDQFSLVISEFQGSSFWDTPMCEKSLMEKTGWDEFLNLKHEWTLCFGHKHQSAAKTRISNHQHWNRKIWFLFIGVVVVIIWIYPQPRMPVTFSSIMNHFSGSGIFNLNLHLWLAS